MQLLSGNDQHVEPRVNKNELIQIDADANRRDLVLPANDTLFTSGTLGRYSEKLTQLHGKYSQEATPTAAD
jgi:NADH-quinone oxidoreductase subunit G